MWLLGPSLPGKSPMDCGHSAESSEEVSSPGAEPDSPLPPAAGGNSCPPVVGGQRAGAPPGRPAAANAARERSRVQTLRHAFLELQKTLPSVPPDTKLSKLDVLLLATTYIAHLTRSLQDEEEPPGEGLGTLRGDGYLHPVKVGEPSSRYHLLSVKKYTGLRCVDETKGFKLMDPAREVAHAFQVVHRSHRTVSDSLGTRRQRKPRRDINNFTNLISLLAF